MNTFFKVPGEFNMLKHFLLFKKIRDNNNSFKYILLIKKFFNFEFLTKKKANFNHLFLSQKKFLFYPNITKHKSIPHEPHINPGCTHTIIFNFNLISARIIPNHFLSIIFLINLLQTISQMYKFSKL